MRRDEYFDRRALAAERQRRGMTMAQLAERAGLTAASISYYESGSFVPGVSALVRLAKALDVPVTRLLKDC